MSKKIIASPNRIASEKLASQIDFSSWIRESFKVSPNSKRVTYGASEGDKWFVVVDGEEEKRYDDIGPPVFSPDSRRVVYGAGMGDKQFVVVDGEEGKEYDGSVRGGRIIFDSPDSFHYLAGKGNNIYLVEEKIK